MRIPPNEAGSVLRTLVRLDALTSSPNQKEQSSRVKFAEEKECIAATSFLHAFSYRTLFSTEEDPVSPSPAAGKLTQITISKEATEERRLALGKAIILSYFHN